MRYPNWEDRINPPFKWEIYKFGIGNYHFTFTLTFKRSIWRKLMWPLRLDP